MPAGGGNTMNKYVLFFGSCAMFIFAITELEPAYLASAATLGFIWISLL